MYLVTEAWCIPPAAPATVPPGRPVCDRGTGDRLVTPWTRIRLAQTSRPAAAWLAEHRDSLTIPATELMKDRHDEGPRAFGMTHAVDLFTDRQLAVFGAAFAWLASAKIAPQVNTRGTCLQKKH